jgi:hypothetical protein
VNFVKTGSKYLSFFTLLIFFLSISACYNDQTVVGQQSNDYKQQKQTKIENTPSPKLNQVGELREIDTNSSDRVLSFTEKNIAEVGKVSKVQAKLFSKIFNQMLGEKYIQECLKERKGLEIERIRETVGLFEIDLDDDGLADIIISNTACGGNTSFPTFVYKNKGDGIYKRLLYDAPTDLEVTKNKTNGYYDIITEINLNVERTGLILYKFRNGQYENVKCGIAKTIKAEERGEETEIIEEKCPGLK